MYQEIEQLKNDKIKVQSDFDSFKLSQEKKLEELKSENEKLSMYKESTKK